MHFLEGQTLGLIIGFVVGLTCPGLLRRLRADLGYAESKVKAEVTTIETKAKSAVSKAKSKL